MWLILRAFPVENARTRRAGPISMDRSRRINFWRSNVMRQQYPKFRCAILYRRASVGGATSSQSGAPPQSAWTSQTNLIWSHLSALAVAPKKSVKDHSGNHTKGCHVEITSRCEISSIFAQICPGADGHPSFGRCLRGCDPGGHDRRALAAH